MTAAKRSGNTPARRRPSAKRIRAARAFSGLERPAFSEATGIDKERLNYLENGKGEPTEPERSAIQRASGVPMSFLRHGFEREAEDGLDQIDRRLSEMGTAIIALTETVEANRIESAASVLEVTKRLDAVQQQRIRTPRRPPR